MTKLDLAHYYRDVAEWMLPHTEDRPLTLLRVARWRDGQAVLRAPPRAVGAPRAAAVRHQVGNRVRPHDDRRRRGGAGGAGADERGGDPHLERAGVRASSGPTAWCSTSIRGRRWGGTRSSRGRGRSGRSWSISSWPASSRRRAARGYMWWCPWCPTRPGRTRWRSRTPSLQVAGEGAEPLRATSSAGLAKAGREAKIFVDYLRNRRGATSVSIYSARARPTASVSVPLAWDQLGPDARSDAFHVTDRGQWLTRRRADPWAGYFKTRQKLSARDVAAAEAVLRDLGKPRR